MKRAPRHKRQKLRGQPQGSLLLSDCLELLPGLLSKGIGPFDLVYVSGWISNIELMWEEPSHARFLNRLASFSRLLLIDKRGTGLSDRVAESELPTLEQRMDDVRAVMDAVGSARAALLGHSEGGNMATFDHSIVRGSGGSAALNPAFGTNAGSNLHVDPKLA